LLLDDIHFRNLYLGDSCFLLLKRWKKRPQTQHGEKKEFTDDARNAVNSVLEI